MAPGGDPRGFFLKPQKSLAIEREQPQPRSYSEAIGVRAGGVREALTLLEPTRAQKVHGYPKFSPVSPPPDPSRAALDPCGRLDRDREAGADD
jgi:hypothetical protein